jgi:hypothetical protein
MTNAIEPEGGERGSVERSLRGLAERLEGNAVLREGTVVLHLRGRAARDYHFDTDARHVQLRDAAAATTDRAPLLEIFAEAETARAIVDGEKDATEQFLAGGIRVRGDLQYLSDVAVELGLLKRPL